MRKLQQKTLRRIDLIKALLQTYKKMTIRQIFYQLLPHGLNYQQVQHCCRLGRANGLIDLDAIVDRSRPSYGLETWKSKEEIVSWLSENFKLNYWANSDYYVEIWTEKDALSSVLYEIASPYRVPVRVTRGFLSVSSRYAWKNEQLKILYFGDFDPSGLHMDEVLQHDKFLYYNNFKRIALTQEQIDEYQLPGVPVKKNDSRSKEYMKKHGDLCWELDALPPDILQQLVRKSVEEQVTFDLDEKRAEEQKIRDSFHP